SLSHGLQGAEDRRVPTRVAAEDQHRQDSPPPIARSAMKRSYLFVPGNRPARFDKACEAGADAVIIDLEDAVAPDDKAAARDAVRNWLTPERNVYLRFNAIDTQWHAGHVELLTLPGLAGVMLPKAESAETVQTLFVHGRERVVIVPLVETALGVWHAERIARAKGVERLAFGSIDFQLDTNIVGDDDELLMARSHLVLASRVAGVQSPIDGVTLALDNEE